MTTPPESAIAIIIAVYNGEATIERAVRSALAQPEIAEICVVDDASTDATAAIVRALAVDNPRVATLSLPVNAGPSAARNAAIAATKAPWIAILDADDYLLEGRMAALLAHAGGADFVADVLIRTPEGAAPAMTPTTKGASRAISFTDFVLGNLGKAGAPLDLGYVKPIFRRAFLDAHALKYRPELRLGEDYEFYARALALGARFLLTPPTGYVSVERPGSLSRQHSEGDLQKLRDCDAGLSAIRTFSTAEHRALARHRASVDCRLQWRRLIRAVKRRDLGAAIATFHTPTAAFYLAQRLAEQAWLRGSARLRGVRRVDERAHAPAR